MPTDEIRDLVRRQCNRAARSILDCKDRVADPYLPDDASRALRKVILDELAELQHVIEYVAENAADGYLVNELVLKIDDLHAHVTGNGDAGT